MAAKVMVVEDDIDLRRNLQRLLESEGYDVDVAENGQVALDLLMAAADLPGVIVLDLMMPVMDGLTFRQEQKKIGRIAKIPVVIMTADGSIDEKSRATQANAALRKPADAVAILKAIEQLYSKPN